jgi:hypothetical protein
MIFATLIVFSSLLHVQYQQWLDAFHNETPSFMTASRKGSIHLRPTSSPLLTTTRNTTRDMHRTISTIQHPQTRKKRKMNANPPVPSEFIRQEGVVIVTKIHGPHQWALVQQSMCLFHHAYNQRLLYDIVVFTAEPIPLEKVQSLQLLVSPTKVTVVVDNEGLAKMIAALSHPRRQIFLDRCRHYNRMEGVSDQRMSQNLTWFSDCGDGRLAYNWQAEFRSIHIWNHPVLDKYQWMLWMDTDAFCTKKWDRDPIAFAIHHNLAIFFDNFPGGGTRNLSTQIAKGFNVSLCKVRVTPQGELDSTLGKPEDAFYNEHCSNTHIRSIYGFLHITNLDFYRSQSVQFGIQTLLGNNFLARDPDDQQAVTIPAAILAAERSWDMRRKGIQLDVFHNLHMDGKNSEKVNGYLQLWSTSKLRDEMGESQFACPVTEAM